MLIQQMLMMMWEAIIEFQQLVIVLLMLPLFTWIVGSFLKKPKCHKLGLGIALVVAIIGFFGLPSLFSASLSALSYWVDWAFHIAMVIALLVYSYIVVLPLTSLVGRR